MKLWEKAYCVRFLNVRDPKPISECGAHNFLRVFSDKGSLVKRIMRRAFFPMFSPSRSVRKNLMIFR